MSDTPRPSPESAPEEAPLDAPGQKRSLLKVLGPGLITGASDDDPSGIATYSQAGAQFGYGLGWTLLFSWPLMCAIQEISARIGRVTGRGIAGNLRENYPPVIVFVMIALLVVANTINLGADIGAMAASLNLLLPGPLLLYVAIFGIGSALLQVFVQYARYVFFLKWLTLSLFAYVGVAIISHLPWSEVMRGVFLPRISLQKDYLTVVVAVLGTTISPYLFFWQAAEEVEQVRESPGSKPLVRAPRQARQAFARIRLDTMLGMALSNIVALAIVVTTAATLHAHGVTNINTSAQAAKALEPIAGRFAFVVFALGIVGTGLLAVPVLAGAAAYALGEAFGWHVGLVRKPGRAKGFYSAIVAATFIGGAINFTPIDPIKALFWSAVINGVAAVPITILIMHMASARKTMSRFEIGWGLRTVGWTATVVMAAAAIGMFATMGS